MKSIKIIFAAVVISAIGFFAWKWFVKIDDVVVFLDSENLFIKRIEGSIDSLLTIPANLFCQEFHKEIHGDITTFHHQGLLGKSPRDNDWKKEILSKRLDSAYASKFVEYAMNVFNGSEWDEKDITLIRSEIEPLQGSPCLEPGASDAFDSIRAILAKYDEITDFISSCKNFSYSCYDMNNYFPNVSDKIEKSRNYLNNNLDNSYVNNCSHLDEELRNIPQILLNRHAGYLLAKIAQYAQKYKAYNDYGEWELNIYKPLMAQNDNFKNNNIYGISTDGAYPKLKGTLNNNEREVRDYFNNINE